MDQWIKIPIYIIIGTVVIAVLDNANTAGGVSALLGGFGGILKDMQTSTGTNTTPATGGQPANNTSGH